MLIFSSFFCDVCIVFIFFSKLNYNKKMSLRQNREAISLNPVQMRQGLEHSQTYSLLTSFLTKTRIKTNPLAKCGKPDFFGAEWSEEKSRPEKF